MSTIRQVQINNTLYDILGSSNGYVLNGTLVTGNTTLTFVDSAIESTSLIDIYSDVYGVSPINVTQSTGSLVLTFAAQETDVHVKVLIQAGNGATPVTINNLTDTNISNPSTGQALKYNATSGKWENGSVTSTLVDLTDTTITSPSNGQVLKYNSTTSKWENGTVASSISDLTDTTITTPANNQVLSYNSSSNKWINAAAVDTTARGVKLIGTLEAGETELTFTNAAITSTARFEVYAENAYIALKDLSRDGTTLTLTFDEQENDIRIKVVIYEDNDPVS